uniref:Homeobox domain-containing protein n=1 Tax=Caenorhabditis tropicalis TaxID=1561998 RepID=A0A1I7THV5_9PELO
MVHSSAFHPYTRPNVTNPPSDMTYEESLRLLLAIAQVQEASDLLQRTDLPKQVSPPISAPVLTPNPVTSPVVLTPEQPLQSPSIPNEKSRRKRTTFSPEQATRLESEYISDSYMAREKRLQLAHSLNLSENQVKTWFQNRRAKDKRDKKTENSSNSTLSRKSSPSRKSSSDSSPTPSLMSVSTPFVLPSSHQIQIASLPTTIESTMLPSSPQESIIQKVEQFPVNHQLIQNFDALNNYIQSLSSNSQFVPSSQSLLVSSSPPFFNPNVLMNFPSPLESAII